MISRVRRHRFLEAPLWGGKCAVEGQNKGVDKGIQRMQKPGCDAGIVTFQKERPKGQLLTSTYRAAVTNKCTRVLLTKEVPEGDDGTPKKKKRGTKKGI